MPMKTSSVRPPLSRAAARNCLLINQLATPGLGSIMAGRVWPGIAQLTLAAAGCGLVIAWFAQVSVQVYKQFTAGEESHPSGRLGQIGAAVFVLAWLWALSSSLDILRAARGTEASQTPPRLNGTREP